MQRHYFIRDRRIEVEEIEGVAAVRMTRDEQGRTRRALSAYGRPAGEALRSAGAAMPDGTQASFEKAGWALVRPGARLREALSGPIGIAAAAGLDSADEVGKVVVRAGGAPAILTDLLNVQLDPELSQDEAEAVLAERGLTILYKLNLAPNLYETRAEAWDDAIAASVDLHDDPRFVFAGPALIEHIPGPATPAGLAFGEQRH